MLQQLALRLAYYVSVSLLGTVVLADTIETAVVEKGHFVGTIRATGRVVPMDGAMFVQASRIVGRVVEIEKREGEHVQVGTPLFRISSAECASLAEEMRVAVDRNLENLVAVNQRRQNRLDLKVVDDDCLLLAAANGFITKRFVEPGANFNIGDPLAHIVDTKRLTIEIDVPEKDAGRIAVGRRATVRLAADTDRTYETKIRTVVPTVDPATRTTRARLDPVKFVQAPTVESFVVADIESDKPETSFILPSAALVFHSGKQWVLKIDPAGGKPTAVAVEVLDDNGDRTAVRLLGPGTLAAGDRVMTRGAVFAFKQLRTENL